MSEPFDLRAALDERLDLHRYRFRLTQQAHCGREALIDGNRYLNFASNDYLGLANHPDVIEAFKRGANEFGVGSGASHLVSGHSQYHHALEEQLADFCQRPRALLFSTGYMANLGVLSALLTADDAVFEDKLNHASLLDGGLASGARFRRFLHADVASLEKQLSTSQARRKLVVTDGVFSMDGDIAPLAEMARTARGHQAWLMVDDAHGVGVLGKNGRGVIEDLSEAEQPQILMATLGKAFGTFGAFVVGSEELIETLIQFSRSYIYTTALPPAVAAASLASLMLVREEHWRREKLNQLIEQFRQGAQQIGLPLLSSSTPIQPLLIGSDEKVMAINELLRQRGFLVGAIRPPTVAPGSARLRITLSASHDESDIDALLAALDACRGILSDQFDEPVL
ncbi:MAG: 8-amino-7-oxononanoate synthase [Gammaproteobacteria bacterium]|mgnify:CR=1 FL=1|nr:8-amino-7-oxononanoate synthase [Gammaproteobacteria bacterium]MBQ0773367.1 8-amino-7-oxononanoate synthase [Gammaproteobacteria bacterium]|tara:strand:- start:69812 stop:71002 length:1191 start_codon:yes stop_codon:yes gene_type:complete